MYIRGATKIGLGCAREALLTSVYQNDIIKVDTYHYDKDPRSPFEKRSKETVKTSNNPTERNRTATPKRITPRVKPMTNPRITLNNPRTTKEESP